MSPWFTAADLGLTSQRTPAKANLMPDGYQLSLLGDLQPDGLRSASPVRQDLTVAPPLLIEHGDQDRVVPACQSRVPHDALTSFGCDSALLSVGGAGHEDERFDGGPYGSIFTSWLRCRLLG